MGKEQEMDYDIESIEVVVRWSEREQLGNNPDRLDRSGSAENAPVIELVLPTAGERYASAVPFIPHQAAAGAFGDPQYFTSEDHRWVRYTGGRKLREGMFVAQVVGRSMEPLIPDGSYCLFAAPVEGSRQGRVVLVSLENDRDPETGQRYTVKRYSSVKAGEKDGEWRHLRVVLSPVNKEFGEIVLNEEDEGAVRVVGEWLEVV